MKRSPKLTTEQADELEQVIRNGHAREIRKAQGILLVDQEADVRMIATVTAYTEKHAYKLRRLFLYNGIEAIADKRTPKPKRLLTKQQRAELIETIQTKRPCELDRDFQNYGYWTTGALGEYIKRTYSVEYKSKTSEYLLFKEARFTYHKPGKVSEKRDEHEIEEWRTEAAKRIEQVWSDPNVVILAADEMHLSNQTTTQKIWLPEGAYPKIEIARKREARSVYGFLNVKEGREHAFKTHWQNMYITAEIIPEVRKLYPDKHILILWDQAGWHKGSEAQKAIKQDGNIETIYFPTAAPEENPQEHVWKSGRSRITHNAFIQNIDATADEFVQYLNTSRFPYSLLESSIKT
jgi:transposase